MTLRATLSTPDGKRRYVRRLFATIADRYDFITRFLSWGQDRRWKQRLVDMAAVTPRDRVLDLACGTGDILFNAAPHARSATGLDLTHRMLQLARARDAAGRGVERPHAERARPHPGWVCGDMTALPLRTGHFDVVTTGYGLRNVPDLPAALAEIHRVLVPGGRLLSLDFNRPGNAVVRVAYLGYLTVVGAALGFVLHRDGDTYRYIPESIRNYPGAHGVAELLVRQGFTSVRVVPVLGGLMAIHVARK